MINAKDMEDLHIGKLGHLQVEVMIHRVGAPSIHVYNVVKPELDILVKSWSYNSGMEDSNSVEIKAIARLWLTSDYRNQFTLQEFIDKTRK